MKQLRIIITVCTLVCLLVACGQKEDKQATSKKATDNNVQTDKKDKSKQDTKKDSETHNAIDNEEKEKQTTESSAHKTGPLSKEEIKQEVALMLLNPQLKTEFITGQELLDGKYTGILMDGKSHPFKVDELRLMQTDHSITVNGTPNGMEIYEVSPVNGNYVTYIGVSREYVAIGGTQSALLNYNDEINSGFLTQYKVSDLEKMGVSKVQVAAVANKVVLGNNEPLEIKQLDK